MKSRTFFTSAERAIMTHVVTKVSVEGEIFFFPFRSHIGYILQTYRHLAALRSRLPRDNDSALEMNVSFPQALNIQLEGIPWSRSGRL